MGRESRAGKTAGKMEGLMLGAHRPEWPVLFGCLLLVYTLAGIGEASLAEAPAPPAQTVDAVGMTVLNLDRSIEFFTKVLSFEPVSEAEIYGTPYERLVGVFGARMRVARLRLGEEFIELTQFLTPGGQPIPLDSRSHDLWFQHIAIVVDDMDEAYRQLRKYNVPHVSTAPQQIPDWNKAAAGIKAFYFRDQDGHNLELIYFPPGKGDPKWQRSAEKLFLGIDHTAIAVRDTDASLKFYRDVLGLKVMGESLNIGTEQEHLANVFGARVHIAGLRAEGGGPRLELVEYLAPTGGRAMPQGVRANDLMHWQTVLRVRDLECLAARLRIGKYSFLSSEVVTMTNLALGFTKGLLVRGPDGHAMLLIEK